jgi:hypothetical protein
MGDGYTVEVTNQAAFDAAMAAAAAAVADTTAELVTAGRQTISAASPPRRTGRMASSARVTQAGPNRARMTVDTPYAAPIHWGWPAHGIRRQLWLVAEWLRNPAPLEGMGRAIQEKFDRAAART